MITLIKQFLWDDIAFMRYSRFLLFLVGQGIQSGAIPTGVNNGGKIGVLISGMALLISSQTPKEK